VALLALISLNWVAQVSWTLYGFIGSQLGNAQDVLTLSDGTEVVVSTWIQEYFDIRHSFIGVAAAILIGFVMTFAAVTTCSLRYLNFQKR
jgi:hypothetical protein